MTRTKTNAWSSIAGRASRVISIWMARTQLFHPVGNAARDLRDLICVMVLIARDHRVPWGIHGLTTMSLWFVILPYDLIPDCVPIYGYLDDLAVVTACLLAGRNLVAPAVVEACWRQIVLSPGCMPAVDGVWVLADDRTGNVNQCLGVAEALGGPFEVKNISYTIFAGLPNMFLGSTLLGITYAARQALYPPLPELVIAAGRRTAPVARNIKRRSLGQAMIVHLMDPGRPHGDFDLIAMPRHDGYRRRGRNIVWITGAPHRVEPTRLQSEALRWRASIGHLPRPWIAVLVGGADKDTRFDDAVAARLGRSVSEIAHRSGGSLLVTTSRRTPHRGAALVSSLTAPAFVHVWTPSGRNPFFGFLGVADYIVVTGDSVSMCTEACATGKPVYIFSPYGAKVSKHARFHEELFAADLARPLGSELVEWRHPSINPAHDVARAIRQLLSDKSRARGDLGIRDVDRADADFVWRS